MKWLGLLFLSTVLAFGQLPKSLQWPLEFAQFTPFGGITGGGGASPPWSFVQHKYNDSHGSNCANTGATCQVSGLTAVMAGDILIGFSTNTAVPLSSINGETWTACSSCEANSGQIDIQYVLSATGGETSFTCTFTSASNGYQGCGVFELSHSGTTSFDTGGNSTTTCGTSCTAPSLTITGTSDAFIQIAFPDNDSATAINQSYTTECISSGCNGIGSAYLLNASSYTTPTWTVGSSETTAMSAIAISGAAASGITLNSHSSGTTASSTTTVTTSPAISGTGTNLIVVAYSFATGNSHTVSDSSSNSYTQVILNQSGDTSLAVAYVCNPTVTSSMTFTITAGGNDLMSIAAATFKNTACPSSYQSETDNLCCTSSGGTFQPGSITASSGWLMVSAVAATSSTADTVNSSFTVLEYQTFNSGSNTSLSLAYLIASAGAVNPTWTVGTQSDLAGGGVGMAAFK